MRFVVTKELGKLARWLRIVGFDAAYYRDTDLGPLIIQALRENRTIITRSRSIRHLKQCTVVVYSNSLEEQLRELKQQLNLRIDKEMMFSRCPVCNTGLLSTEKEDVKGRVPEHVYLHQNVFMGCPDCKKIYWQGSHWGNINEAIKKLSIQI